jgi:hypothetical protein
MPHGLLQRICETRVLENDAARRGAIEEILNWNNPGGRRVL